ncbi:wall-associated receptor kinase 2-like [Rutidosis leptorrhynchoides]|uniref:wall-associated receptor kinase 2-like n=1 Tax=Rutidosis leptorrhynchoides TaxID=125765 RepID=UPI003A9A23BB
MKMILNLHLKFTILIVLIAAQSLASCPDKCGNVTVPYPFGTKDGCYLSKQYYVNCTSLQITNTTFKLLNISLDGYMRGSVPMSLRCYDKDHTTRALTPTTHLSGFQISNQLNLLTTVGCDAQVNMKTYRHTGYITGCLSMTDCNMLTNGSCFGMGCSQVPVPYKVSTFRIETRRNPNANRSTNVGFWGFNNCTYGFVAEKDYYMFSTLDLDNMDNRSFPVVFEWSVGETNCEEAQKNGENYICAENSVCIDILTRYSQNYRGYRCQCAYGFQGNPYIPNGCQDINECEGPQNDCIYGCTNTEGDYTCSCPLGQKADGRKNGKGCTYSGGSLFAGVSMGTAASIALTLVLYAGLKQRKISKSREILFKKNGGLILQKLLFESKQSSQTAKIFAAEVLEKSTNNFHKTNVIGQGGYGTVYKGTLPDKTMIAIKKSKSIDQNQIEQFINEVIILSEISHPNVVKLMGCCLETQTPLLVYEYMTNKTVFQHLHEHEFNSSLTFEKRLNIATQTAEALAYMHSTTQIIHRDIKSSNILLTDDYTAKVSDFELLTGRKVFSYDGTESEMGLATYFVTSLEMNCLIRILDDKVKKNGVDHEHIKKMAKLAKECVELSGKNRPNMREVKETTGASYNAYGTSETMEGSL